MASLCGRLILRNTRREFSTSTPWLGWFSKGPKYCKYLFIHLALVYHLKGYKYFPLFLCRIT